jgi:hypothetical protein
VVVGLNDAGIPLGSAEYAENLIGVYVVTFTVPSDAIGGVQRNLVVAIDSGGLIFSNASNIAIQ